MGGGRFGGFSWGGWDGGGGAFIGGRFLSSPPRRGVCGRGDDDGDDREGGKGDLGRPVLRSGYR